MSEWQPIDTAPKDGTAIWLLVEGQPYIGYCEAADQSFRDKDTWFVKATFRRGARKPRVPDEIVGCYGVDVSPTHWQPLPSPLPYPPGPQDTSHGSGK